VEFYCTYCFSTATMVTRTRLNVTLYVHCLSCSIYLLIICELTCIEFCTSELCVTAMSVVNPPYTSVVQYSFSRSHPVFKFTTFSTSPHYFQCLWLGETQQECLHKIIRGRQPREAIFNAIPISSNFCRL